ncbi:MAG: T9SS type A sorting domain-containing protein [Flavobacteriales bacterium]|nr:T9SS type A sorting domain-containing protein [Flavobacteriales bacterium]
MSPRISLTASLWVAASVVAPAQEWQWVKQFGASGSNDHARIAKDTVGNYYLGCSIAGLVVGPDTINGRNAFMKLNGNGEPQWGGAAEFTGNSYCSDLDDAPAPFVAAHPAGSDAYFAGEICGEWLFGNQVVNEYGNGTQIFLAHYDGNGDCTWVKIFGGALSDHVASFEGTPTDELLLTYAGSAMTVDGINVPTGVSILKFNAVGVCQWAIEVPPGSGSYSADIAAVEDGFYLASRALQGAGPLLTFDTVSVDVSERRFVLVKYNYDGHAIWGRSHGENMVHYPGPLMGKIAANSTGVLLSGSMYVDTIYFGTDSLIGAGELFMIRFGPDGSYLWSFTSDSPYGDVSVADLVLGDTGDAYALCRLKPMQPATIVDVAGCAQEFDSYDYDSMYLVHLDEDGDCIQSVFARTNSYGSGPGPVRGRWSMVLDAAEQPVVCGQFRGTAVFGSTTFSSGQNFYDVYVGKLDALDGIPPWEVDELLLYANPNQGSFRIKVPTGLRNEVDLLLSVFDSSGRLVRARQLDMSSGDPRMDVSGVAPGLYKVTLSKGDRVYHGSMVVE